MATVAYHKYGVYFCKFMASIKLFVMQKISMCALLAACLFSMSINARTNYEGEDYNRCSSYNAAAMDVLLQSSAQRLRQEYGRHAQTASTEFIRHLSRLYKEKTLLIQLPTALFTEDTTPMPIQWQRVFKTANNRVDSIEAMCGWIAAHMINAEHRPDLLAAPAEHLYKACTQGNGSGDALNFAVFLARVSQAYPHWGEPVVLTAAVEVEDTANGPTQRHSWVGYAKTDGEIWCLADPINGGVVRHAATNQALPLDTIRHWLTHSGSAKQISLRTAPVSLQSTTACVFSFLLRSPDGAVYWSRPGNEEGFVKAAFYTPADTGHYTHQLMAPVWKKKKMPTTLFYNYYGLATHALLLNNNAQLLKHLQTRYALKTEVQE